MEILCGLLASVTLHSVECECHNPVLTATPRLPVVVLSLCYAPQLVLPCYEFPNFKSQAYYTAEHIFQVLVLGAGGSFTAVPMRTSETVNQLRVKFQRATIGSKIYVFVTGCKQTATYLVVVVFFSNIIYHVKLHPLESVVKDKDGKRVVKYDI